MTPQRGTYDLAPVMSVDMPVITDAEVEQAHAELDTMLAALGEYDAEVAWRLIMASVEHSSRARLKQHLAVLLVLALRRLRDRLPE